MSWLLYLNLDDNESELISSRLWDLGTTGLAELPRSRLVAGFETELEAETARQKLGRGQIGAYDPTVVATPEPVDLPFGIFTIKLPDTSVFGHGSHPTTVLALDAVSRRVEPGMNVLDMGCGTGALGIAAALLGATVKAIDNDWASVRATTTNALANDVAIEVMAAPCDDLGGHFDVIVANMLLADLRASATSIQSMLAFHGTLATTGFLGDQESEAQQLFSGLNLTNQQADGDWVLLELLNSLGR